MLIEFIPHGARAPRISFYDGDGRLRCRTARGDCEIHPVQRVDVFGSGPDGADLEVGGAVDEGVCGAVGF